MFVARPAREDRAVRRDPGRAWNLPTSSSLAEEERLHSLLTTAGAIPTLAAGIVASSLRRNVCLRARSCVDWSCLLRLQPHLKFPTDAEIHRWNDGPAGPKPALVGNLWLQIEGSEARSCRSVAEHRSHSPDAGGGGSGRP
jgi:hypothetical protein